MLYIFLFLSSVIFYNLFINNRRYKREAFTNTADQKADVAQTADVEKRNDKPLNIILLGDSIFKNNAYVKPVYSVEYLLKQQSKANIYCLAKDGANIEAVYKQIAKIPERLNTADSTIFLSVGGNDLLVKNSKVDMISRQYDQLLMTIQRNFPNCKLNILNLYTPPRLNNDSLQRKIKQWNNKLQLYVADNIGLISIDTILYEPTDFVADYEPSEIGGLKIVKALM
jgi:hypothetical protein